MRQTLAARFDGTSLQPEEPLHLVPGTRVQIIVESILPDTARHSQRFLQTARALQLQGPPDWSENLDQDLNDLLFTISGVNQIVAKGCGQSMRFNGYPKNHPLSRVGFLSGVPVLLLSTDGLWI